MKEIIFSIMYVYRQVAKFFSVKYSTLLGGNVDWFYGLAIPYVVENRKNKKNSRSCCYNFVLVFLLIGSVYC